MNDNGAINGAPADLILRAALSSLREQHVAAQDAAARVAIVHWFDSPMLAALASASRPAALLGVEGVSPLPGDLLMVAMESLPFVEPQGVGRFRLHAHVRWAMLKSLLTGDQEFVTEVSQAAVHELLRRHEVADLDIDELLELAYLLLVVDEDKGVALVDDIIGGEVAEMPVASLDRLMRYVDELAAEDRLSDSLINRSMVWSVWTASAAGDYGRAADLGDRALRCLGPDSDLAGGLTYDVAFARWRLGESSTAIRLAQGLAEGHPGTRLGALATMLLGDMAESVDDSETAYRAALGALLTEAQVPQGGMLSDPHIWGVGEVKPDGEARPQTYVVIEHDDKDAYWVPADLLFAELWLRLGTIESRRGRMAGATAWLQCAETLFRELGDTDGFQRTMSAQQRLATHHGDPQLLREIIETYKAMLVWAQATESKQIELQTHLDLADAYTSIGDLESASAHYHEARALGESRGEKCLAALAAEGLARIAINQLNFDDADRHIETALTCYESVSIDDARRLDLLVGERWLADRKPSLARRAYERIRAWASANDQPDTEVSALLGLTHVAEYVRDLHIAEKHIKAAVSLMSRIDPVGALDVLYRQSTILRLQHRDAEAASVEAQIEDQAATLSMRSMLGWLIANRADTAARRGQHIEAARGYRDALGHFEAIEEEDGVVNCLSGLAWELSAAGQPDEAQAAAVRVKDIAAKSGRPGWMTLAVHALGTVLVEAGEYSRAIAELLDAHRRDPNDSGICINLGWAYLRADQFEESLKWSRRALQLNPSDAFPNRNVGHALLGLGRYVEAREAYEKAVDGRFGDEHFRNTLEELELLGQRHPGLAHLDDIMTWFRSEQAKIDAAETQLHID